MLEALRSFVSGWVAKILLILLIGSFALWGVSGSILGGGDTNTVVQVGETKVPVQEFMNVYAQNMNTLQRRAGRRLTRQEGQVFGVESQTLSTVVSYATLDEFARTHGISMSDKAVAQMIADNPAFHDSTGKFNRDTFQRAIYEAQMRESEFISAQHESAVRSQITRAFAAGDIIPDAYKNALSQFAGEERKFSHITITPAIAGEPKAPTSEQLKTYFEANKANYKAPEYRKFSILSVEPADIADEKAVTDEAIKADYMERLTSYSKPEMRRVQQIVFKSKEDADKAVKSLSEGGLFETVLTDNNMKVSDADLGLVEKKKLPKAVQDPAFALELNTPSAILEGPFGPTMIRVTEIEPAKVTPLKDVEAEIRKDLALRVAADSITTMHETVEDMRAGGSSIADTAEQLNLKVRTIEALDRTGRTPDGTVIKDLPESNKLIGQIFDAQVGSQDAPLDFGSAGYIWVDLLSITPTRDRTFEEAGDAVKTDWIAAEQATAVDKKTTELEERLKKGAKMADIAKELAVELKTTGLLKRAGENTEFPRNARISGFAGGKDHFAAVAGSTPGEKLLIKVEEIKRPEAQVVELPENEMERVNEGAADDLLNQMINNLQQTYEVRQYPEVINLAVTQNR